MNLVRTGAGVGVGVVDGFLEANTLSLGTTVVSYGTIVEAVALIGGAVMQIMMPYSMPELADGLVDGGAALLAFRGTKYAKTSFGFSAFGGNAGSRMDQLMNRYRSQVGSVGGTSKRTLT